MKFLISILVLCSLLWSGMGVRQGTFGMAKSSSAVLNEFSASVNRIVGAVGYIQCYDITDKKPIAPVTADVTLSNIEISGLKIATEVTPEQLNFTTSGINVVILPSTQGLKLALKAAITLSWSYKVMGATIYRGTYSAQLLTERPTLLFTLFGGKDTSAGLLGFGWILKNGVVTGFGATSYIQSQLEDIMKAKLFSVLNEELNRYNDIIVSAMVYNYFYRHIKLPFEQAFNETVTIKNVFTQFNASPKNYLTFVYNSSLYFAIQHKELPLVGSFEPIEESISPISLYLSMDSMKQLGDVLMSKSPVRSFIIGPEDQKKFYEEPINVRNLASFYPKFTDEYEARAEIDINCTVKNTMLSATKSTSYACKFVLHSDPKTVLIDISALEWTTNISIGISKTDLNNRTVAITQDRPRFSSITIQSPAMPRYVQAQFLSYLQPLSAFAGKEFILPFPFVNPQLSWKYNRTSRTPNGDATFSYDL